MSKKRRDKEYLSDILEAIKRSMEYTREHDYNKFLQDKKAQDAVVRNLEVVGEATKNISAKLRKQHPNIPWKDMAGLRDKLIHHYFGINYEIVWNIVEKELPVLLPQIEELVTKGFD